MKNVCKKRADWFPNTFLSPEFADGTIPLADTIEDGLWSFRRTSGYQTPEWATVVADRGFTSGTHYFEFKIIKYCRFMISLLSPDDENLITKTHLASHPGDAANPLLSKNCTAFYSGTESMGESVRNIHDMKIDDHMTPYRDALLAAGMSRDFFNSIADDPNKVCAVRDHRDIEQVRLFAEGQRRWDKCRGAIPQHLEWHGRNFTYPHPVFDWAGCRVGFLMDLDRGRLYLLVYFAGKESTSYDEADKRMLFAVLGRGRRYFPAISIAGCEGALELRTSTEVPAGYGDVAGQLQEARAQVVADRAAMAAMEARLEAHATMEARLTRQEAELRSLRAAVKLLQEQQQTQSQTRA